MIEFFKWIIDPQNVYANVFACVSIVVSGGISWGISKIFYSRGNRNNLKAAVLHPVRRLLENKPSRDNYRMLIELTRDYNIKYLKRKERPIIDELLFSYRDVYNYNYESVCAESLLSYFYYKLRKNGIDPLIVPVYIENEIVMMEVPDDMYYCRDNIARTLEQYPPEYDTEKCTNEVVKLFEFYCKTCYATEKIVFFDDNSILEVIKKAKNRSEWNDKFNRYKAAKEAFLNMKVLR